jgi:hypothetical protein
VPKRLAILGVLFFALIAAVIVLPRRGQVFSADARVAAIPPVTAFKQAPARPATGATAPQATQTSPVATPPATPSAKHSITVKFDYDFSRSPVCSAKVTSKCVQQFNVYDVSGGPQHRVKLFSVPVPAGASGQMKGITATSPQLVFEPGTHFFAVTAQPTAGDESNPVACQTTAQINP